MYSQACRDEDISRLVHTSTSEVYGTAQYVPIDEKHPIVGQSPYSASKIGADKLAESYLSSEPLWPRFVLSIPSVLASRHAR